MIWLINKIRFYHCKVTVNCTKSPYLIMILFNNGLLKSFADKKIISTFATVKTGVERFDCLQPL